MNLKSKPTNGTAARILRSADELFCDCGYGAVSVRDIADRAGVNKASVFYHFNSKAELFERVLHDYYDAHIEALAHAFGGEGSLRERTHRVIDAYLDFIAQNRRYARLIQQMVAGAEEHHDLIRRNLQPLFDWTLTALGTVAPATGPLAARQFFVTLSGIVINYFTYAPVFGALWGDEDPLGPPALEERRQHIHWLVDVLLERTERD